MMAALQQVRFSRFTSATTSPASRGRTASSCTGPRRSPQFAPTSARGIDRLMDLGHFSSG
jgi:hypothetical protein